MQREKEYRSGGVVVGQCLVMIAVGAVACYFVTDAFLDVGKAFSIAFMVFGAFVATGLSGLHLLIRTLRSRIWVSDDGIRYRNMWGKEINATWNEVRRMRWRGVEGDTSEEHRHIYEIETVHGLIHFDSTFAGYSQIERVVYERSSVRLQEMSLLDAVFNKPESRAVAALSLLSMAGVLVWAVLR